MQAWLVKKQVDKLWQYILLGVLLMIASAALSLLLIHRLERRLGIRNMWAPPS